MEKVKWSSLEMQTIFNDNCDMVPMDEDGMVISQKRFIEFCYQYNFFLDSTIDDFVLGNRNVSLVWFN